MYVSPAAYATETAKQMEGNTYEKSARYGRDSLCQPVCGTVLCTERLSGVCLKSKQQTTAGWSHFNES